MRKKKVAELLFFQKIGDDCHSNTSDDIIYQKKFRSYCEVVE